MKTRTVVFHPAADDDILRLYDYIAVEQSSPINALNYIERIESFCRRLDIASERGTARDDLGTGTRVIGFERTCQIAFSVEAERVVILRIFYGGQDWEAQLN